MEYAQNFKEWTKVALDDFICKHYYVSDSDVVETDEEIMKLLGYYGKLKNTNNDVIKEKEYKEICNGDKADGLRITNNVLDFIEFCNENDIKYQGSVSNKLSEVRVDMFNINREQLYSLEEYFDRYDIDEYEYVIVWN